MSHKNDKPTPSIDALIAERDRMRAILEAIAREVRLAQAVAPTSPVAQRLDGARKLIDELVRDRLISCPSGMNDLPHDPSPTGTFELVEDPEETEIILADLEYLARQQQQR